MKHNGLLVMLRLILNRKEDLKVGKLKISSGTVINSNGKEVEYGRLTPNLVKGYDDIVFYFETSDCYNSALHEKAVRPLIDRLMNENEDHGAEWRIKKINAVIWKEHTQTTLVNFRIRDSY